ncbi:MAG: thiamine phosphate synthase [Candidatus Omnitrophica bacterium]|nr:thiamine phosphate synthase [Candidatus Omnitrophota bacterium]
MPNRMMDPAKPAIFKNFRLYAVTDVKSPDESWFEKVRAAYEGGADIVQLRSKTLSDRELYHWGLKFRKIADEFGKLFFVNDRPDLAIAVSADGIHVGQNDFSTHVLREMFRQAGVSMWIGKSTHSMDQAIAAGAEGADYIGVGPVFSTPTKKDYIPVGLSLVRNVAENSGIPFVCIGGIDLTNVDMLLEAGAHRIAVVRAIFEAKDVYEATRKLRARIETFEKSHAGA